MNETDGGKPGQSPVADVEQLLRHASPEIRAIGARLAGKLELGCLRPVLRDLECDPEEHVRKFAAQALKLLTAPGASVICVIQTAESLSAESLSRK
jgi:hypothetical protein